MIFHQLYGNENANNILLFTWKKNSLKNHFKIKLDYSVINISSDISQFLIIIELKYINKQAIYSIYIYKIIENNNEQKLFYQLKISLSLFTDIRRNSKLQIGHFKNALLICKKHSDTCSHNKYTICGNTFSYFRFSFLFLLITTQGVAQNAVSKKLRSTFSL